MTRTVLVMANWKQQGSEPAVKAWLHGVNALELTQISRVLCVPLPYLVALKQQHSKLQSKVLAGAQLVSPWTGGAYTGEVSAAMLKEFAVTYTLVGHSERRQWLQEPAASRRAQIVALWQQQITPVLCVGETAEQYQHEQTFTVLQQQLAEVFDHLAERGPLVLAYEPVFAIGSGHPLSATQAQAVHQQLRLLLQNWYHAADCQQIPILYGGSVNSTNAADYLRYPDIDGVLVGSSSLQADSFNALCVAIQNAIRERRFAEV